jgi:hypothetical protein
VAGLAAGGYWITAVYSGNSNYAGSWAPALIQTVNKKAITTTVASSSNPSTAGEAVTYMAKLSATAATGTVEFKQAGVTISGCSARAISSGAAKCTVADPVAGGYGITAVYSGDSNYVAAWSPGLAQTVNKKTITTTVSSSSDPSTVGEAVIYRATLSTAAATGTVEFKQAGVTISGCSARAISSGAAKCNVADPVAGGYGITAVYSGDSDYAASWSLGWVQTVNKKVITTTVASSSNPATAGQVVVFTATVSAAAATGTVEFKQAGVAIGGCAAQAISAGIATCTMANLAVGWPWITAVYSGDNRYAASWSPALTQTVTKRVTTATVASSSNPSKVGQAVTYTATVSPAAATGTLEFKEEGTPITGCTALTISSGMAKCTVPGYPKWSSYAISTAYSGDASDLASVSTTLRQTVEPPTDSTGPFRFFSASSVWNKEVPTGASLDPTSAAVVKAFAEEVAGEEQASEGAWINTVKYSVPVYTVPAAQPTVSVRLDHSPLVPTLQSAWDAVPLPPSAKPAAGTDGLLAVWQPSTDRLWEFWRLVHESEGWSASWGGAMQHVSSNPGVYGPEAWPGAEPWWGASASSLSIAGGLITLEDVERGVINHALGVAIPNVRKGVYASPAQRDDGTSTNPLSLPEGAHLRLNPNLNLAALHLPRMTLMIAEAAQRYGIYVRDKGADVQFYAQDPVPTGTEPYAGPSGYFEGNTPIQLLASFPWSELQLLKMELHETS